MLAEFRDAGSRETVLINPSHVASVHINSSLQSVVTMINGQRYVLDDGIVTLRDTLNAKDGECPTSTS